MSDLFLFRNTRRKAQINLTSLIDCMFMLILFFILTTSFNKNPGIEITLPKISKGVDLQKKETIEISVTKEQKVFINGKELPLENLVGTIKGLTAQNAEAQVFMKADTDVAYGFIVKVMNELRIAGVKNVAALAEEEQQKAAEGSPKP
jgi:biopolymer transport protein ExbD